jgi:hypothetical protein
LLGNTTIGTADLNLETLITMDNERIKKSLKNALEANAQKVTNASSSTDTSTVLPAKTDAGETYAAAVTDKAGKTDAAANTYKDVEADATENTGKAGKTDAVGNTEKDVELDATENTDKAGKTDAASNTFQVTSFQDVRQATSATGITQSSLLLL